MKGIEEINYNEMYKATKQRMSFDSKKIKQMLLYNYINDEIDKLRHSATAALLDNMIIDCRKDIKIPAQNTKKNFRLILILNDNENIKDSKNLESVRNYIKNEDNINKGIYHIFNTDYTQFCKDYSFDDSCEPDGSLLNEFW